MPFMRTFVGVVVAVLLLAACGEREPAVATSPDGDAGPTTSPDPGYEDPDAAPAADEVTVWFPLVDDSGVWIVPEPVALPEPTTGVLRAAVEAMVEGRATNPNLSTSIPPDGTAVLGAEIDAGVATIDLSGEISSEGRSSSHERAFAQQLVHTATQFHAVEAVRLVIEGDPITELWGHLDWSQPIDRDPSALAPIIIEQPAWGSTRPPGPVIASGSSVTFESTVELRLVDPDGAVAEETFTTALQPDVGRRGPWEHTFDNHVVAPGTWTIEATEPDPSGGEGRPPFSTSVEFEVS